MAAIRRVHRRPFYSRTQSSFRAVISRAGLNSTAWVRNVRFHWRASANYALAVKGNQPGLLDQIRDYFEADAAHGYRGLKAKFREETDTGHGRIEVRRGWHPAALKWVPASQSRAGAKCMARIECERHVGEKVSREVWYYISSLATDPERLLGAVRGHRGIEDRLYRLLYKPGTWIELDRTT